MEYAGMLLATSFLFTLFIEAAFADVEFGFDKTCYNEGDAAILTATYTGAGTEQLVNWFYENRASADNTIDKDTCFYDLGVPDLGYPAMTYNCDDKAQHIYKATITSLPQAALGKEWGVSFTLSAGSGGSTTGYKKEILVQCTSNDGGGLTLGQKLGIGLGVGIPVIIVAGVCIGYFVYKHNR